MTVQDFPEWGGMLSTDRGDVQESPTYSCGLTFLLMMERS